MSPQNVQIVCRRLLKSDQFCRCLAISTWSFPQRALEWPRILGAVPSVGSRALATQASETKPRSCVTSNLRKMGKKLSFALRCCRWCCKPIFLSYFSSPKTFWSLSRFKVEAFLFLFAPAAFLLLLLKTAYSALSLNANYPLAQRRSRSFF